MQSVYRSSPITLSAVFEDGAGDLTDPLVPLVTILDPLGVQIVLNATPVRTSLGNYHYVYTPSSSAMLGWWTIRWTGTVAGQGLGPLEESFQVLAIGSIAPVFNGSYTYDVGTDLGYIRLTIDDKDFTQISLSLPYERRSAVFTDEELQAFLNDSGGDIHYAIARALRTIAVNRSLLIQSRRVGRTEVNFGSIRTDLMKAADEQIAMSNAIPAEAYAEVVYDDFSLRRVIINESLRRGA